MRDVPFTCVRTQTIDGTVEPEALMLVATLGGPTMSARIGMLRALNRHVERVFNPSRKAPRRHGSSVRDGIEGPGRARRSIGGKAGRRLVDWALK